jgi:ABC-type dipeptide/oligopeptide/nickel transport system permease component
MTTYIIRRILQAILVLLGAVSFTFIIARVTGDPAKLMLPEEATQEAIDLFRVQNGLDKPVYIQYINYISQIFKGDLGLSMRQQTPVTELILERFPATLKLTFAALFLSILISFPLGIFVALKRNSIWDLLGTTFALIGQATPSFWTGLMLILIFGVTLKVLPISGSDTWQHLVLPSVTLSFFVTGRLTRLIRSGMLEVMGTEYIRTARVKGLFERTVIWIHALKNASIPVVTMIGLEFAGLLGGALIIETIFAWPGIGRLVINAVLQRDFPIVQGVVLISAATFTVVNLLVDLLYSVLDPRISYK